MAAPFREWSTRDALKVLDSATPEWLADNRAFVEGDHWQDGRGWRGPHPGADTTAEEDAAPAWRELKSGFVSRNAIQEVVERHAEGVIGQEPVWNFTPRRSREIDPATGQPREPTDAEERAIRDISEALTQWWDARDALIALQEYAEHLVWAGRAVLRIYIPPGLLEPPSAEMQPGAAVREGAEETADADVGDDAATPRRVVRVTSLQEALAKIWVHAPAPEDATVHTDDDTKEEIGIRVLRERGQQQAELTYLSERSLDGARLTVLRTLSRSTGENAQETQESIELQLGGRLLMYEGRRRALISAQVRENQRALNLATSVVPRNTTTAGFLERILLNAQMPGHWEKDAQGRRTRFVPDRLYVGAGTTNFYRGIDYVEKDSATGVEKTTLASPSVVFREPSPSDSLITAKRSHYVDILEEVSQAHVLLNTEALPSGISREQSRADHTRKLARTAAPVNGAGRWLLETVLALAEWLMDTPGQFTDVYRAEFAAHLDTGPLSPDEIRAIMEQQEKGYLSQETAMQRMGTPDTDAELQRIRNDPVSRLSLAKRQAETIQPWVNMGLPLDVAARLFGGITDPAILRELAQSGEIPTEDDGTVPEARASRNGGEPAGDGEAGPTPATRREMPNNNGERRVPQEA